MLTSRWIGHGDDAIDALHESIRRARAGDALAPVTVVTPTPAVAVATRRALIRRSGAAIGIGFHSLGAVAEMVAGPALARAGIDIGVDRELVVAAVRRVLATDAGGLGPIRHHRSTWEAIARTIGDLGNVEPAELPLLDGHGPVAAEVRRVHDEVRRLIGVNGPHAVLRLAVELAESSPSGDPSPAVAALGPVVVHLPDRLSRLEQRLVRAVSEVVDVTVLVGRTGHEPADAALAQALSDLAVPEPPPAAAAVPTQVISANDIDDEVRAAVRCLLALAEAGVPTHRMALVHPPGAPYARIVAGVLDASGVHWAGPSTTTLAESVAGRVLARMIAAVRSDLERSAVVDLWSTGVIVAEDGDPLPFARFDELTRRFGTVRGVEQWRAALDAAVRWVDEQVRTNGDETDWAKHQRAAIAQIGASVERLAALAAAAPAGWDDLADWCAAVLDELVGPRARRSWPDGEFVAEDALRTALGRLAALASVETEPTQTLLFETVDTVLAAPAPRAASTGTGLIVTTLERPPLAPLDAVVVVGMVEGHSPRVEREDVLLGDAVRSELGLPTRDDAHGRSRRAFHATLASAGDTRILTFARHDQRSGRALVPSRWLIDAVDAMTGHRPEAEDLIRGTEVTGVDVVASYQAGLAAVQAGHSAALDGGERILADLAAHAGIDAHPAVDDDLRAGITLIRSRASRTFTRFDGNVGHGPDITGLGVLSPTSLETYAACPRRWFFAKELKLQPLDRPEEVESITPMAQGRLVHKALERFFGEAIEAGTVPPPGADWPVDARARLQQLGVEECDRAERMVATGHPRRWAHDRAAIAKLLDSALDGDTELRGKYDVVPDAVEFTFGRDQHPPLRIDLGDGRVVALAGQADRVDVDVDGGQTVIWDYKVASSDRWAVLDRDEAKGGDPLGFGTKLQLVAYAMAATDLGYDNDQIRASYWFLSSKPEHRNRAIGYPVTDDLRARFRHALRVLADGIGAGRYPARPGEYEWHLGDFEHCAWCEFTEICPADRDDEWVRVQLDPTLRDLLTLVEHGSGPRNADGTPADGEGR